MLQRHSLQSPHDLFCSSGTQLRNGFFRSEGGVRSMDHAFVPEQRMVVVQRLWLRDIQCSAPEMAGIQGIEKRAVIDEAASGCVDQEGARLHGLELVLTEQTGCLFGQRHVETDEIGMAEQYIERHRSDLLFGRVYRGEIS